MNMTKIRIMYSLIISLLSNYKLTVNSSYL